MIDKYDEYFTGGMGAEAVRELVQIVDLKAEMEKLETDLDSKISSKTPKSYSNV